jgi:hypothetical protein
MTSIPNGNDPEPKITRKGDSAQPKPRSIEREIQRESDKRKNGSN